MSVLLIGGKIQRRAGQWACWCTFWAVIGCVEVKKNIDQRIPDNRRISIDKTASEMSVSWKQKAQEWRRVQLINILFWWSQETCEQFGTNTLVSRAITYIKYVLLHAIILSKFLIKVPLIFYGNSNTRFIAYTYFTCRIHLIGEHCEIIRDQKKKANIWAMGSF